MKSKNRNQCDQTAPKQRSELVLIKIQLKKNFTQIPNQLIYDKRLSIASTGLLTILLSMRTGGYISMKQLCSYKSDGETSMRTAMEELESAGYLSIHLIRDNRGRIRGRVWVIREQPETQQEKPELDFPIVDLPYVEKPNRVIKAVHNTVSFENCSIQTTTHQPLDQSIEDRSSAELLWLCQKLDLNLETLHRQCDGLPSDQLASILAEAYAVRSQNQIQSTVQQFVAGLVRIAHKGKFVPCAGVKIRGRIREIMATEQLIRERREQSQQIPGQPENSGNGEGYAQFVAKTRELKELSANRNNVRTIGETRNSGGK